MFTSKKEIKHIYLCLEECQNNIKTQETINKQILKTLEAFDKDISELEKIVKNQPLIKKYQKTLDIFLKNAQDKPVPMPRHCCTGMTMEEWESVKK